jgi:ATP-binding cassette subfamily B multidrug efflux pump
MSWNNSKTPTRPAPAAAPLRHGPFGRGPMGYAGGEKAKDFKGALKKLASYIKPFRFRIALVIVFALCSTVFLIIGPKLLGNATTILFEGIVAKVAGTAVSIDFGRIGNILITLAGLYVLSTLFSYIQGFIISGVAQKVAYNLRREMSAKINALPLKYFDSITHGEVLSRITNDVDTISHTLGQVLSQIVTSVATILGVLVMMLTISWLMTLVSLLILPLSWIFVSKIIKKSHKYFRQQQEFLGRVNGHVEETYSNHIIMKSFNGEKRSAEEFDRLNEMLYKSAWKSQFLSGMMMPLTMLVGNLGYVMVALLGGYLTVLNIISVGDIQAFIQYVRSFTQPISQSAQVINLLQSTAAAAERVFEFLIEPEEKPEPEHPKIIENPKGEVVFDHVRFGYNPDEIVIKDFSLSVQPGSRIAIVGPTGAGKTTIVKLLMRFYDVNSGAILVDGHDIRSYSRSDLRSMFGMVLQDAWLFCGTIAENIRFSKPDASDSEVVMAAKMAYADGFIRTLPGGYQMEINEDASNISLGQKQLLTIARAILANPKILILDEATSSVDTRTEVLIQRAMDKLMQGRTSFIIAHRLSTIRDADMILVMRDGDIIEQGNHEELLAKNGFYATLYNSQFET